MSSLLTVGLSEAKSKLSELVYRAAKGEEIVITRHDEAIAKLVAATRPPPGDPLAAVERILELRRLNRGKVSAGEIARWKNAGCAPAR